ncbi:MAG: hypothetical protein KAT77_06115 [Nanoarchaeota archaeon]|nr:hypothetical protein [Nanoarchaeota archaeon]
MKVYEKEWVDKIKKDFFSFKKKKQFDKRDEGKLLAELTGLLGWFNLDPSKQLKTLIEEFFIFAEKKKWEITGQRIAFEHMKKHHQIK